MPKVSLRDPVLYIDNANSAALEAYFAGERFFVNGEIRPGQREQVEEIGAHLVPLPPEALGSTILLRLQASGPTATLANLELGEGRDALHSALRRGALQFVVGLLALALGMLVFMVWMGRRKQVDYLGLSLFTGSLGLVLMGQSNIPSVALGSQQPIYMVELGSAFWSVPGLLLFVARGVVTVRRRWLDVVGLVCLAMSVIASGILVSGGSLFIALFPWVPFGLGGSAVATVVAILEARRGNRDARLLLLGLSAILLTGVAESLAAVGIDALRGSLALGVLGLASSLAILVYERFKELLHRTESQLALLGSREAQVNALSAQLAKGGHGLTESIGTLKSSLDAQSEVVARQASAIAQTQVSATEVGQVSARASQKANEVREVATQTESAGRAGGEGLAGMVSDLDAVRGEVGEMTRRIVGLGERARKLDEIVMVIEDLGDQTNVLAINANIEAARAGEQGKSFAIVAQEMRSLALQSAEAAGRIRKDLQSIAGGVEDAAALSSSGLKKVEEVVSRAQASADHLRSIVQLAVSTAGMAKDIATSVEQQHGGVGQMVEAIREFAIQAERLRQAMTDAETAGSNVREVATALLEAAGRGSAGLPRPGQPSHPAL
ncbi:MAG: methyl-accepting chemotaxis protein [Myxococcales bacterium]